MLKTHRELSLCAGFINGQSLVLFICVHLQASRHSWVFLSQPEGLRCHKIFHQVFLILLQNFSDPIPAQCRQLEFWVFYFIWLSGVSCLFTQSSFHAVCSEAVPGWTAEDLVVFRRLGSFVGVCVAKNIVFTPLVITGALEKLKVKAVCSNLHLFYPTFKQVLKIVCLKLVLKPKGPQAKWLNSSLSLIL